MKKVSASSPSALSFFFKYCRGKNISATGSIGIGCTIDKKVIATVNRSKSTQVFYNKKKIFFPTVLYALAKIVKKPVRIEIESELPLGYGFGISAGATCAVLYAVNILFNLNITKNKLAEYAHEAEVINKTGLGSVATIVTGGFIYKTKPGINPKFVRFPFEGQKLYAVIIDKLETPKMLNNRKYIKRINQSADIFIRNLQSYKNVNLYDILDLSREFAQNSRIIKNKKVAFLIDKIYKTNGHASMAIFGNVVISSIKPQGNINYPCYTLKVIKDIVKLI